MTVCRTPHHLYIKYDTIPIEFHGEYCFVDGFQNCHTFRIGPASLEVAAQYLHSKQVFHCKAVTLNSENV